MLHLLKVSKKTIGWMAVFAAVLGIRLFAYANNEGSQEGNDAYAPEWFGDSEELEDLDQIILVGRTEGSRAKLSMYQRDENRNWYELLLADAFIGRNGLGKTKAGDEKTPVGMYHFTEAFGILEDPGCGTGYHQVRQEDYWCGDSESPWYNLMISEKEHPDFNRSVSEHLINFDPAYHYCLNISYNEERIPYAGSAIFLHCYSGRADTGGCISVPEETMVTILQCLQEDCRIIIGEKADIDQGIWEKNGTDEDPGED